MRLLKALSSWVFLRMPGEMFLSWGVRSAGLVGSSHPMGPASPQWLCQTGSSVTLRYRVWFDILPTPPVPRAPGKGLPGQREEPGDREVQEVFGPILWRGRLRPRLVGRSCPHFSGSREAGRGGRARQWCLQDLGAGDMPRGSEPNRAPENAEAQGHKGPVVSHGQGQGCGLSHPTCLLPGLGTLGGSYNPGCRFPSPFPQLDAVQRAQPIPAKLSQASGHQPWCDVISTVARWDSCYPLSSLSLSPRSPSLFLYPATWTKAGKVSLLGTRWEVR